MKTRSQVLFMTALAAVFFVASAWGQDSSSPANSDTNQPQVAQPSEGGVNWKGVGIGAGAVASNMLYVPAKLVYGVLGGIAGGAGYALTGGNKQVADTIWRSSLGGDYVITPDMLAGKEPVHFSGPTSTAPANSSEMSTPALTYGSVRGSNTASSTPDASGLLSSGADANASIPATHPIDSGAGPVSGASPLSVPYPGVGANSSAKSYSSSRHKGTPTLKAPLLPDTRIE